MIREGGLHINKSLYDFIQDEILTESIGISSSQFWTGLEGAVRSLGPQNLALLQKRDALQAQLDQWYLSLKGQVPTPEKQKVFLKEIGYLVDQPEDVKITVTNVDPEIATIPGPQLVVPLNNSRFAINAANSRWRSIYDALYGSDVIPEDREELKKGKGPDGYNPQRGQAVIAYVMKLLDKYIELQQGVSFAHIDSIRLIRTENSECKLVFGQNGRSYSLLDENQFIGYSGGIEIDGGDNPKKKASLLFRHNGLHIEIVIDPTKSKEHPAFIVDILFESALTTIQDCEDSVAVVDAEDKVLLYRNWLGLMNGDLTANLGNTVRKMAPDREFIHKTGKLFQLPGRSLMLIRHTAHHVYTDMIRIAQTDMPIPETFLDAFVTCTISLLDLKRKSKLRNSQTGSVYVVKPKLHGPEEVQLVNKLFGLVEETLGLSTYTIKLGIMDEERRTSLNLKECLRQVDRRAIFINTGFLDRTGDEIHTSLLLRPFKNKSEIKNAEWIEAYEKQNVEIGLCCGLIDNGQIGKGMWAEPDNLQEMLIKKINHLKSGANTAWVPSPTAATLHAIHYHEISVKNLQKKMLAEIKLNKEKDYTYDLLKIPILDDKSDLSQVKIQKELENNIQSILGYVVRWIDQGIGCSKVPNIDGVSLMEDRATLRISSQLVSNWLKHKLVSEAQVFECMRKISFIVDQQNKNDSAYLPMETRPFSSLAFQAALDLVFRGHEMPNGYTELILRKRRLQAKRVNRGLSKNEVDYLLPNIITWSRM